MKISIITSTFNSESTIADTFDSILGQTYGDFEYIVIDGGSEDKTLDIVRQYELKFGGRMRWISEKDDGVYFALNKGLGMATGDVVGFLNSDDFYTSSDCLQTVVDAFANNDVDAIYGDVHYVNGENLKKMVRYYSSKCFRPALMRIGLMPAHPSFYCKLDVYKKYGLFDTQYRIASDFEILLRFIYVNKIRTKYINRDFVIMRTGGLSTSGLSSHRQIMKEHRRALKINNVRSNFFVLCIRYIYKVYELSQMHVVQTAKTVGKTFKSASRT